MGFFDRLFGTGKENPAKRSVKAGQICAKCGQPVPLGDNMAFDSGGGKPIHRICPPTVDDPQT